MERLTGKVAFITGAGTGIGRAPAVLFGREGARVGVADIDERSGRETASIIDANGGDAIYVKTDVSRPESVREAVRNTVHKFGKLDVVFNNAGGSLPEDGSVTDISVEVWKRTHSADLFGTFLGCNTGFQS